MNDNDPTSNKPTHELHVTISDMATGRQKVDLHLPPNLAAVALRSGARLLPPGHDGATLLAALEDGTPLNLDVVDEANGERIVISVT